MNVKEKLGLPEEATDADVEQAIDALMQRCAGLEQVQNALGLDKEATNDQIVEALNAVIENCGELQTRNAEIENEKLANEAQALVAENEDVLPEDIREEVKNEYVENPENAKETVANYRRIYERAVINAAKGAKTAANKVVFRNSEARRPVEAGGIAAIMTSCNGDPVAINAAIAKMAKR